MDRGLLAEDVTSLFKSDPSSLQHGISAIYVRMFNSLCSLSTTHPPLPSDKDVGDFSPPLPVPCWGFIFTSSPGHLCAKLLGAGPDSTCQLTLKPAGCLKKKKYANSSIYSLGGRRTMQSNKGNTLISWVIKHDTGEWER